MVLLVTGLSCGDVAPPNKSSLLFIELSLLLSLFKYQIMPLLQQVERDRRECDACELKGLGFLVFTSKLEIVMSQDFNR